MVPSKLTDDRFTKLALLEIWRNAIRIFANFDHSYEYLQFKIFETRLHLD